MISALMIIAGLSALFSLTARTLACRLAPATAALVFTMASVTIAAASSGLLAVTGWYGAARFGPIADAGGWSTGLLARTAPVPLRFSMCAGLGVVVITVRVAHLWVRRVCELRAAQRSWPSAGHDDGITVTAERRVNAFAVEGTATTRRIVLTEGLLRALPNPDLQRAVIEHEHSHLRHHHLLYRLAVETAAYANPILRPITRVVDEALEAWADDDASHATAPAAVATAIVTVALTRVSERPNRIALAIAESVTVRRVERLLHPTRTNNAGAIVGAGVAIGAVIVLGVGCRETETFFEALRATGQLLAR